MVEQQRASKKQQELLSFVDEFITTNGYGPSYREIMNGLGYKSVSTVAIHIDNLIAKGFLARRDKSARSLEVVSLHAPAAETSKPTVDTTAMVEAELLKRISTLECTDEDRRALRRAFELLDFPAVAVSLQPKETDEKII